MKLPVCPTPSKRQFTRAGALVVQSRRRGLRAYRCRGCRFWHMTSRTAAEDKATKARLRARGHGAGS